MNKVILLKYWATITLASILVAAGYELKKDANFLPGVPTYILAAFAFIFGASTAKYAVENMLKLKSFRKKIFGSQWIEGYWLIRAHKNQVDGNPLSILGILYLYYDLEKGELVATTTRYDDDSEEFKVNSEIAYVRAEGSIIRYLNYFTINYSGTSKNGMAFARLSRGDEFSSGPDSYEGTITIEGEGGIKRQSAQKISDTKVKELYLEHGNNWKKKLLESNGALAGIELPNRS